MSETSVTDETTDETVEPVEATQEPQEATQEPQEPQEADEDTSPNREAAKYRRRLRETEAERDQLREQVDALRRAEVERVAGAVVQNPAAIWAAGVDVADLLDDDGRVDEQKVRTATQEAAQQLGLAPSRRHGNFAPLQGRSPSRQSSATWQDALKGS